MSQRILVVGASGLIGQQVLLALRRAGMCAVGASRKRPVHESGSGWLELAFDRLESEDNWLPLLQGFDVVINCLGIIREARRGDFDRLHRRMPCALFAACERAGVRQIIQLSASGARQDASTEYWRSKAAADQDLLHRSLPVTVVRPTLVYGDFGASSKWFRHLASMPLVCFPFAHQAMVQPVHVADLAAGIVRLVQQPASAPRELAAVGPRAMTIADYLHALNCGMQSRQPVVLTMPRWLARTAAHLTAVLPGGAFTPAALQMLEESTAGSQTGDAEVMRKIVGCDLRTPEQFATPTLRSDAVLGWALPLLQYALAFLWLWTAWVSWFAWPHDSSQAWLWQCGIPSTWAGTILLLSVIADGLIGLRLLWRPPTWIWPLQLLLVLTYTVWMTRCLPDFWLHPFGPLSKNVPLLAILLMCWRLQARRT